jgi:hypothetical protein
MWLIKKRRDWPYKMLGMLFAVSDECASKYCSQIQSLYVGHFLPRLFYLPHVNEVDPYIPQHFKDRFPNAKLIGDGTHVSAQTPEKFSYNGLTFCVYKWGTTWQFIIGMMF